MLRSLLSGSIKVARPGFRSNNFFKHNLSPGPLKSYLGPKFQLPKRSFATHRDNRGSWNNRNRSSGANFWQQWKIPVLFTAGVIGFDHLVFPTLLDSKPLAQLRRHPEYLVYGIMAINGGVFLLWRVPAAQKIMYKYFLLQKHPSRFNAWSMIGSAFSHQELWHLGINMFVLYQFGIPVAHWLGSGEFLASYMDSCVLSGLGSLVIPHLLSGAGLMLPSLGASGAIYSIFGIFSYLAPNARLALWFIPLPIGAWWVFLASAGYSLFQIARRAQTGYDHAGHLAGALTGIFWGWFATEKARKRRAERQKKLKEFEYRIFR